MKLFATFQNCIISPNTILPTILPLVWFVFLFLNLPVPLTFATYLGNTIVVLTVNLPAQSIYVKQFWIIFIILYIIENNFNSLKMAYLWEWSSHNLRMKYGGEHVRMMD
jgi:hypothetical protein